MKVAFLFSGQGAQYPGMMKELYDNEPAAREIFDKADTTLGREISKICFAGTQEDLNLTHNTQPCMLAGDLAAAMALRAHGVEAAARMRTLFLQKISFVLFKFVLMRCRGL